MSGYDQLRYSFDNILKELDDICKSIDDLTDIEQNLYLNNTSNEIDLQKRLIDTNNGYPTNNSFKQTAVSNYQNKFNFANFHLNSRNSPSLTLNRIKSNNLFFNRKNNNYNRLENQIYEDFKRNLNELDNSISIAEFQASKGSTKPSQTSIQYHQEQLNEQQENSNELFLNEINNLRHFPASNANNNNKNSYKKWNSEKPNNDTKSKHSNNINNHSSKSDNKKKHKLPNELNISLNSVIGSVRENILSNLFPLATNRNEINHLNSEQKILKTTSNSLSPKHKIRPKLSEVSFSIEDNDYGKEDERYLDYNQTNGSHTRNFKNDLISNHSSEIDNDYLSLQEVSKIECFYNSMGCYVYVSRCIAELYQIKREDEFDAMDNDPVNDYQVYMENIRKKKFLQKINGDYDNFNDENGENSNDNYFSSSSSSSTSKSNVNYMYINSGVPVIVFNYGANPKRGKDLRILLAERSTGFCMWEFKFDKLTQYENSDDTTVIRLTLNNNNRPTTNGVTNGVGDSTTNNYSSSNSSLAYNSNPQVINYQNEYFEKYFNSKGRHAHKEHLLKFVIKRDCDEFCFKLMKIMNDRRNSDLFVLNQVETTSKNNFNKKSFINSSSVIICHFDFLIYNNLEKCLIRNSMSSSLTAFDSSANSSPTKPINNTTSNNLVNNKKHSTSTSTLVTHTNNGRPNFSRNESLRSSISNDDGNFSLNESITYDLTPDTNNLVKNHNNSSESNNSNNGVKYRKLKKSDISSPVNFSHVTHLDKPVPIGKRYKLNYKS